MSPGIGLRRRDQGEFTPDPQLAFSNGSQLGDLLIALVRIPTWIAFQVWTGGMRRSPVNHFGRYVTCRIAIGRAIHRNNRRHRLWRRPTQLAFTSPPT